MSVGGTPRLAQVEVCDSRACEISTQLVRGDQVSFVTVEQAKKVGCMTGDCPMALNDREMPADIVLQRDFVVVHDASGTVLNKCDIYVVRWTGGRRPTSYVPQVDMEIARRYFKGTTPVVGTIAAPVGAWKRIGLVRFIRYRRPKYSRPFEHEYTPPVMLYGCSNAFRLPLGNACIVDERGFVRP